MASAPTQMERNPQAMLPQELSLWTQYEQSKSAAIREKLFVYYLPLVRKLAARHYRHDGVTPIEFDELVQFGCTGLLEAIDRFNPDLAVPFRYFGNRRISGSILNGIAKHSEINEQISHTMRLQRERLHSLKTDNSAVTGIHDTLDILSEIAGSLAIGLMLDDAAELSVSNRKHGTDAYETVAWKQAVKLLQDELEQLPARDRDIICLHYLEGIRFDQIAVLLRVSKGRISQMHKAAIALLRKRLLRVGQFRFEG
jgi:RNA polymerase sigma factor FliA